MNDAEYVFHQTTRERKQSSIAARHIKRGSKTKKVSLPSDFMTKKEIKAMSGEIRAINFNAPVDYGTFLTFSESTQRQYVQHLCDEYNVSFTQVFKGAFGLSSSVMYFECREHLQSLGLFTDVSKKNPTRMTKLQHQRWVNEFLNGDWNSKPVSKPEPEVPTEAHAPALSLMQVMVAGQMTLQGKVSELSALIPALFGQGICTADISCADDLDRSVSVTGLTATDVASMLHFFADDSIVGVHLGFENQELNDAA